MTGILSAIYCFLQDMIASFRDVWLAAWDSLLSAADALVESLPSLPSVVNTIPAQYAWILGATGIGEALAMIATAMGIRFLLQSVPFVRWGS